MINCKNCEATLELNANYCHECLKVVSDIITTTNKTIKPNGKINPEYTEYETTGWKIPPKQKRKKLYIAATLLATLTLTTLWITNAINQNNDEQQNTTPEAWPTIDWITNTPEPTEPTETPTAPTTPTNNNQEQRMNSQSLTETLIPHLTIDLTGTSRIIYTFEPNISISENPPTDWIIIRGEIYNTNLRRLHLTHMNLTDSEIEPLRLMTNLEVLRLDYNQISDISVLSGLTNLTTLSLRGNQINDISSIRGLYNLTFLNLYNNQISNIEVLRNLINLTSLNLRDNELSDINTLSEMTNLRSLSIRGNPLADEYITALSAVLTNCVIIGYPQDPGRQQAPNT